jgi:hypothetical protein
MLSDPAQDNLKDRDLVLFDFNGLVSWIIEYAFYDVAGLYLLDSSTRQLASSQPLSSQPSQRNASAWLRSHQSSPYPYPVHS